MSAKETAIRDIRQDLKSRHKAFIAFHKELNPVMGHLVRQQLRQQSVLNPFSRHTKAGTQLIARCFFCRATGRVSYENYSRYYNNRSHDSK